MKKYEISVVVCVADDTRIKNLLDSIKVKCEVLVVLNGATDEVKEIVESYKNSIYFILTTAEIPERNLSKARNVGMKKAHYNNIVFYDSDCIMTKNALNYYNEAFKNYMLIDGRVKFKDDTFQSRIISFQRSMGLPGYALCPSIGIRKDIIKKIDYYFDEDIKWIEDSELNNRAKRENVEVGIINQLTCIHDNLTFRQDLKSAFRYGTGVKIAAKKGLHKKRPTANWNLIGPCFKKNFFSGIYCIIWNIIYCIGYYFT